MKLAKLKKQTWQQWVKINSWGESLTTPADRYVEEIKQFGDLRYKATWIKALARYEAKWIYDNCLDSWSLPLITLNFTPQHQNYDIRHEIFGEFLMYSDGLELIKDGLEDLFSQDFTQTQRKKAHGFFELVAEREREYRGFTGTIGLDDRVLTGIAA